ncbi:MAG TPA: CDP-diacylglycerol--glycerol-3-phosphate 3-phosphatidyltransferase [Chitinophagales bacterium]|nr:CDP-diacylglycerol--glycerol-3-phosphate 3-phosphatidyltransferase [Chitinophagales bacterium]
MMNFPNTLSFIRILIAISAPFFLIEGSFWVRIVAGILCFIAITTDFIDGWYARKYNQVTTLGKILDPIADKALVLISLSVFVYLNVLSIWWIIPIFIREIVVTAYRFIFLSKNIVLAAAKSGKIKTVFQMITLGVVYAWFMVHKHYNQYMTDYFTYTMYICLIVTVYHTIISGYTFFKSNWKIIKRYHEIA